VAVLRPAGVSGGLSVSAWLVRCAVTGPDQQLPGLRRVEVVQGHQDAGSCGDPLGVTQRGRHLVRGAGVGQSGGGAFPVHDRGGGIGQHPDEGGIGITGV